MVWIKHRLRRYLVTGLLVVLPLGLTLFILGLLVQFTDRVLRILPASYQPDTYLPFHLPGLGLIVTLILILCTGVLVENLLGRRIVLLWERVFERIPLVSSVYSATKQMLETLLSDASTNFRQVVLVEYPRPGLHAIGFITGQGCAELREKLATPLLVSVFVPTTPNPTSGFLLMLPEHALIPLDMSVEDGLKYVISGGIVTPSDFNTDPGGRGPTPVGRENTE